MSTWSTVSWYYIGHRSGVYRCRLGRTTLGVLVLILAVVAVLAIRFVVASPGLRPGSGYPESPSQFYPRDETVAFVWVSLAPGGRQAELMAEAGESLYGLWPVRHWVGQADAGFVDTVGLGIDDVAAWVGPDLSAGLAETRDGSLRAAGTAGVRDHAAASEFMSRWIAYWERETGTSFRRYSTGDATVWAGDGNGWMGDHAYALLPDMLAFATSRDVLDELLVRVDGTEASSLEDSPSFTEARQVASGKRFASVFLDHRWLSRQLWPWGGSCAEGMMGTPRWLSMSARWEEKALVFDFVAPGRLAWGTVEGTGYRTSRCGNIC